VAALAFPAVALATTDPGDGEVKAAIGDAQVVPESPLHAAANRFDRLVATVAQQIRTDERKRVEKRQREAKEEFEELPGGVSIETLESIAACESGGDPTIVSSDGSYRGKYQFSFSTWETVGGSGDPAEASEAEQDYRAALLYSQSGSSPWPVCG
jgi:transglycosylase-like protein